MRWEMFVDGDKKKSAPLYLYSALVTSLPPTFWYSRL